MDLTTTAADFPDRGILGEETLVLRFIFGHLEDSRGLDATKRIYVAFKPIPAVLNIAVKYVILVIVDFDKLEGFEDIISRFHIGISYLETQGLQKLLITPVAMSYPIDSKNSILRKSNIHLSPLYMTDTIKAAQLPTPTPLSYGLSLQQLLDELQVPFAYLHNAGNHSHRALRALLAMVVVDAERTSAESPG
ncbi:ribonuclease h [Paramyrothecium foliicola]|nr:ribonuclease h [Paramyrothecium foliicola]